MKTVIILNNPSFGEKNYYVITEVNRLVSQVNECISICPINLSPEVVEIKSAVINPSDLDSFKDGMIIALDTESAKEIINIHTNSIKVLFLWELDWLGTNFNYSDLINVLTSDIQILVRTEEHQEVLQKLSGKKPKILNQFNLEQIWNSLNVTEIE